MTVWLIFENSYSEYPAGYTDSETDADALVAALRGSGESGSRPYTSTLERLSVADIPPAGTDQWYVVINPSGGIEDAVVAPMTFPFSVRDPYILNNWGRFTRTAIAVYVLALSREEAERIAIEKVGVDWSTSGRYAASS